MSVLLFLQNKHRQELQVSESEFDVSIWENPNAAPGFQLKLRRTHLVEDTFRHLSSADHSLFQRQLLVTMSLLNFCVFQFFYVFLFTPGLH